MPHGGAYLVFTHMVGHVFRELPAVGIIALQSECYTSNSCWRGKLLLAVLQMLFIPFWCRRELGSAPSLGVLLSLLVYHRV